jgi:hypothetical protein
MARIPKAGRLTGGGSQGKGTPAYEDCTDGPLLPTQIPRRSMTKLFLSLLRTEPEDVTQFSYIDPPFNFNHPDVVRYPPEVSGHYLMQSLRRRLGWTSFKGKRLLDFGCGVRFSRTIVNLGIDIGLYCGVDVNAQSIAWLKGMSTIPGCASSISICITPCTMPQASRQTIIRLNAWASLNSTLFACFQ